MGCRQTNIVWVAFVALQSIGPLLIHTVHLKLFEGKPMAFSLTTLGQTKELLDGAFLLLRDPRTLLRLVFEVLKIAGGYLAVWLVFVAFLVWNDGIVVGDRSAHAATFHPTQLLYFCAFTLAFSAPFFATKTRVFLLYARRHYLLLSLGALLAYATVDGYTLAHPYLLADNRHYTFYVWRKVITRYEWAKYALLPAYVYGAFCILHALRRTSVVFKLTFPLFVFVSLSPQLLLEFRYFIVPYLLYRLQVKPSVWWKLGCEGLLYVAVNLFTVAVFVLKPFKWEHDPSDTQRIIW